MLDAAGLSPLLNDYTIGVGPPRTIVVPHASRLASLVDVTVEGLLLKKQFVRLDPATGARRVEPGAQGGLYPKPSADGDLHFALGAGEGQPHIVCELQNALRFIPMFNAAIGQSIAVSGFFRCLFEHPGFRSNDDAHIFEIHPVRAVSLGGQMHAFDVDPPEPASIHTWTAPTRLNDQDGRIRVGYEAAKELLTFTGMDGMDENYVRVSGRVSRIKLPQGADAPGAFQFASPEVGRPLAALVMAGTSAARQLQLLQRAGGSAIEMIALRNIDLGRALRGDYAINLLAIDIRSRP